MPLTRRARRRPPRATCRRRRARRATRSPSGMPRARLRLRRRPHRQRPGRDRALPARRVARAPRAAGHGAAARAAGAAAARGHARGHARVLPRARARLARGPDERGPALRARAPAPRGAARAARAPPAAERTIAETSRLPARRGRGARAGGRRGARAARDEALAARSCARCRPGSPALVLRRLAERAAGGRSRSRARTATRSWPWASGGTQALDLGGGLRAVAEYGTLRFTRARRAPEPRPVSAARARPGRVRRLGGAGRAAARAARSRWPRTRLGAVLDRSLLAPRRPHAAGRPRRHQVAAGPVHRPQGPARTAPLLPVVESDGEIVWVAGVAVAERFKAAPEHTDVVSLSARQV